MSNRVLRGCFLASVPRRSGNNIADETKLLRPVRDSVEIKFSEIEAGVVFEAAGDDGVVSNT